MRLQEAAIALLLTHPDMASAARRAIAKLDGEPRVRAIRRYVAAAALQRMWRSRLALWLGPKPLIEPAYLDELRLPSLQADDGRATLWTLAAQEEARYGYDAWAGYGSLMDLLLAEMALSGWAEVGARTD